MSIIPKARLISKEAGIPLTEMQKTLHKEGAAFLDRVLLEDRYGKSFTIETIRNTKNQLLQKTIYREDSTCQRDYFLSKSKRHSGGKLPCRTIEASLRDLAGNLISQSKEIFNLSLPSKSPVKKFFKNLFNSKEQKPVITKSKFCQSDFQDGFARTEISGISQFKNKTPEKFYQCKVVKDSDGNVLTKSADSNVLPKEALDNEYLHMFHYDINNFRKSAFKHLVKKNDLEDRGITLVSEYKGYGLKGEYDDETRIINSSPICGTKDQCINNIAHELEHARQDKEITLLNQGLLKGERLEKAKIYDKEFKNYVDGDNPNNYDAYESQAVEVDARKRGGEEESLLNNLRYALINAFAGKEGTLLKKQVPSRYVEPTYFAP